MTMTFGSFHSSEPRLTEDFTSSFFFNKSLQQRGLEYRLGNIADDIRDDLRLVGGALLTHAAVRHRHIRENPFPPKSLPRMDSAKWRKRKALSPNTILKIVDAIPSVKHRTIAAVLAYAGLRIGEALALKWSDVDFRRGYLSVERSADAKTRKVGKPKTTHSVREVPLDPALVRYLRTYRNAMWKKTDPGDAWMFPSERRRADDGGDPIIDQRAFAQRHWDAARKKITSDRITPHTARHLWISKMVTIFPVADVSMWAGHHSPAFTWDRYVRPLERKEKGSPIKRSIYETKGRSR